MTGQHFVFLETISGMKRALSRADDGMLPLYVDTLESSLLSHSFRFR